MSENVVSENLFVGKFDVGKICFGKFGVGKSVSENMLSEKFPRPDNNDNTQAGISIINLLLMIIIIIRKLQESL